MHIPSLSSALSVYSKQRRRFWSSNHFAQTTKDYYVPYESLIVVEKDMNEILLSFYDLEICYHYIT